MKALAQQGADADIPLVLGSVTSDLVYTPVTPCRVFDSRVSQGGQGPIPANGQRNVLVVGTVGFPLQGGFVGGCGIPVGATSAIINFVTVLPAGPGNIRAWAVTPGGVQLPAPLAAVLNYGVVSGLAAIANGIAVPLCNPAAGSCAAGDLRLQADTSATDILGDVVGYFGAALLAAAPTSRTYRWAVWHTYDQSENWFAANDANMFGGILPSNWTDNNAVASSMSSDKGILGNLFNNTKTIANNGHSLVHAHSWPAYSSTNGEMVAVLLRVRNTTASAINWTPYFRYTSYSVWGERASLTLNGEATWNSGGNNCSAANAARVQNVTLSIPPSRTSTVIVVAGSGTTASTGSAFNIRAVLLAFYNGSLNLPAGLEFVDDLDTAANGWAN